MWDWYTVFKFLNLATTPKKALKNKFKFIDLSNNFSRVIRNGYSLTEGIYNTLTYFMSVITFIINLFNIYSILKDVAENLALLKEVV